MFTLITFLFNEPDIPKLRIEEIHFALKQNQLNPHIGRIILLTCPKFDRLGVTSVFLIENNIESYPIFGCNLLQNVSRFCQPSKKIIMAYPDVFFPVNSGIGRLKTVNLRKNIIALTPYHLSTVGHIDSLYTGIIRSYQNKKIKSHGIDGRHANSWIFTSLPDSQLANSLIDFGDSLDHFESPVNDCLTWLLSQYLPVSNPCLEIVSIKMHQKWHPKRENCNQSRLKELSVLPCTVNEIGTRLTDSSRALGLIDFQTAYYNGEKIVKMPVNMVKRGVDFTTLQKIKRHAYPQTRTKNVSQLSSRLLDPEKVMSTFMMSQQRGGCPKKQKIKLLV